VRARRPVRAAWRRRTRRWRISRGRRSTFLWRRISWRRRLQRRSALVWRILSRRTGSRRIHRRWLSQHSVRASLVQRLFGRVFCAPRHQRRPRTKHGFLSALGWKQCEPWFCVRQRGRRRFQEHERRHGGRPVALVRRLARRFASRGQSNSRECGRLDAAIFGYRLRGARPQPLAREPAGSNIARLHWNKRCEFPVADIRG